MTPLALTTLGIALIAMTLATTLVGAPDAARRWIASFPRSRLWAWVLMSVTAVWSGWLVLHTPLGRFESWKPAVFLAAPGAVLLAMRYMDDLLAPRALGAILLLAPSPILAMVRVSDTQWRCTVAAVAYFMIAAGLVLVVSPYRFRTCAGNWTATDRRCRILAATLAVPALFLATLAVAVL